MPFPTTGILDNFNRANENPVSQGGNWTSPQNAGDTTEGVVTNVLVRGDSAASTASAYRSNASTGDDCEVFATVAIKGNNDEYSCIRLRVQTGTLGNYYQARLRPQAGTDLVHIDSAASNTWTQLGAAVSQEFAVGDAWGLEAIGTTLTFYFQASGGSWSSLFNRTDSTYATGGYLADYVEFGTWGHDDFGGGTVVTGGPVCAWLKA